MTSELQIVIEDTYQIFAHERLRGILNVCTCPICMDVNTERALHTTPLRETSSQLLTKYTNYAHGWSDEIRYFLPRYFELIALGEVPDDSADIGMVLRHMSGADWRAKWPADEVEVIERFFDLYFTDCLNNLELAQWPLVWRLALDITDVLTLIVTAGGDIDRVLRAWAIAADPAATIHMAAARLDTCMTAERTFLDSVYLEEYKTAADKIGEFLLSSEVTARIENAFFEVEDARLQQILSDGL